MNAAAPARASGALGNAARLFGYDVFISFALGAAPRGSRSYASDLARRLRELDYTVFFSEEEAPAGGELDTTLKTALRRSRVLVVIANRGTLADPRWVRVEVEEFRRMHPDRPVIPISIGGALEDAELGPAVQGWLAWRDRIWINDTQTACDEGVVSDESLHRLATAPTAVRASTRWRWTVRAAFGLLAGVTAAALWFAWSDRQNAQLATQRRGEAEANAVQARANAEQAGRNAQEARRNADLAERNEANAVANAASAASEAERARRAEADAVREAESARTAERQALAGRLAAESQLARATDPRLALLLAREAWSFDATQDTRRALFEALHEPIPVVLGESLGQVRFVDLSSDGRYVAAGGADGTIRIWRTDAPSAEPRRITTDATVMGLAFSPDGRTLMWHDTSGRLRLWDAVAGTLRDPKPVPGASAAMQAAWLPDGRRLVLVTWRQDPVATAIVVWDVVSEAPIGEPIALESPPSSISYPRKLAVSPGGDRLAITRSGHVEVWDLAGRKPVVPKRPVSNDYSAVVFLDDDTLVHDGPDGNPIVWNLGRNEAAFWNYYAGGRGASAMAYSRAAGLVAIGDGNGQIRLWRDGRGEQVGGTLDRHRLEVGSLAFGPGGRGLVSAARDGTVVWWRLGIESHRDRSPEGVAFDRAKVDVTIGDDLGWTVLLDKGGRIEWFAAGERSPRHAITTPKDADEGLAVAADGSLAIKVGTHVALHDAGRTEPRCRMSRYAMRAGFSPDGRLLLTRELQGVEGARLWDARTCAPVGIVPVDDEKLAAFAWSHDSRRLWLMDDSGLRAWNVAAARFDVRLDPAPRMADCIGVDPRGRFLATRHFDGGFRLHDITTGRATRYQEDTPTNCSMSFSPDGNLLAMGRARDIALWDLGSNQPAGRPIPTGQTPPVSVAFSSDGRTLVSMGANGVARRWLVDGQAWADRACERAQRNLSCAEWRRVLPSRPYRRTCANLPGPEGAAACAIR